MKKLLLCTTVLTGLVAGSAVAEDKAMSVTVGGSSLFEVGSVKQSSNYKQYFQFSPNQKSTAFWSTSKAYIKAEGKTAEGLVYGAVVRVQTVANSANGVGDTRNDRSHIYIDSDFGSLQLGSNAAASKLMQVTSGDIASATGGVNGDWDIFVNNTSVNNSSGGLVSSMMFTGTDTLSNNSNIDGKAESARRISYFSPRFNGLQLGLSYAPDISNNGGQNTLFSNNDNTTKLTAVNTTSITNTVGAFTYAEETGMTTIPLPATDGSSEVIVNPYAYFGAPVRIKNAYSIALNYMNNFNDVDLAFAATYDAGNTPVVSDTINGYDVSASMNKLKTWSVGGSVGYKGFSVAAHYGNNGKSLTPKSMTVSGTNTIAYNFSGFKSTFWDAGLAYENGPMSASFTYLAGKTKMGTASVSTNGATAVSQTLPTIKTTVMSLGADYQVAPGLKPFVEITQVKLKPTSSTYTEVGGATVTYSGDNNKATIFMLGTQIKF